MDRLTRLRRAAWPRPFFSLVAFSLAGSLLSRLTHLDPGPIAPVASLLTLGAGVFATFAEYVRRASSPWSRLLAAWTLGATAEIVGLTTGFPFGRYVYTGIWWPSIALPSGPFPVALPFAWLLMAGASVLSMPARPFGSERPFVRALLGGALAATIDLAMEPVLAGTLRYWRWIDTGPLPGGAPIANFIGWWGTATLAGLILIGKAPRIDPKSPRWVLVGFLTLIVGLGLVS